MTDGPSYGSQVVLDALFLDRVPNGPSSNTHSARVGIGNRIVEISGEINNQSIFCGGGARDAMPPTANCNLQVIVLHIPQSERNVGRILDESHDSSRPLGVGRPPSYRVFIAWVGGSDNVTLEQGGSEILAPYPRWRGVDPKALKKFGFCRPEAGPLVREGGGYQGVPRHGKKNRLSLFASVNLLIDLTTSNYLP